MRYALIGCGRISPNHLAAAQANGLDIVALCDLNPEHIEDKIVKFSLDPKTGRYTDYNKLIDEQKNELISICTLYSSSNVITISATSRESNAIFSKELSAVSVEASISYCSDKI